MSGDTPFDAMFSGVIGQDYQILKLICPLSLEMNRLVGEAVATYAQRNPRPLTVVELGGGTGITSLTILSAADNLTVLSIDSEPTMQNQAQQNLQAWVEQGRLQFSGDDALTVLQKLPDNSADLIASAYTFHNFECDYREQVINEMYRVLKSGGQFINGDRYALDDINLHTKTTQREVAGYFKVLIEINRLDLLEHWIIHLFNDESENHIMREALALKQLSAAGFSDIKLNYRLEVNALVTAVKP